MDKQLALAHNQVIELFPTSPFAFDATFHKPDHFPSTDNFWEPGVRWQTMRWQGKPLGLKFENRGGTECPKIVLTIWSEEQLDQAALHALGVEIGYRCNLYLDLSDFNRRFAADPQLGTALRTWRGMRPLNVSSLYDYLVIAIILQNTVVRRSITMMRTLYEHYGILLSYDGREFYCSWEPEVLARVDERELRDLKLGYRAKSLKRVSMAFADGEINEFALRSRAKEEQRQALLKLYGIGPASVWYILFDVYHHLDELNHISPWEQRIYSKMLFDTDPAQPVPVDVLLQFFDEHFGPYKMLAVHYLWEDLFWRQQHEGVPWLDALIRR